MHGWAALLLFSIWLTAGSARAAGPSPASEPDVIVLYGNHIYDDDTILKEAGLGFEHPSYSDEEIRKRLLNTGFFSRVRVARSGARLRISVVEKTPQFILPYFSSSSDRKIFGVAAGLIGADEGASQLLARYQIGNGDHEASLYYFKDFVFDSMALVTGSINYESAQHDIYVGRDAPTSFANWAVNTTLGVGYHLSADLLAQFDTHVELHRFEDYNGRDTKGTQVSHRVFAEIGSAYEDEGLVSGQRIKPYFEFTNPASTFSFIQWGAFAQINLIRNGDFNWITRPRFEMGQDLPRYQLFEIGGPRLRGYSSQTFRSDHYSSLQNDFMLFSADVTQKFKLRPFAFADFAYVNDGGRPGVGLGLNLYFRHVSVPAIQVAAGYGFRPAGFSIAAAIGPQL